MSNSTSGHMLKETTFSFKLQVYVEGRRVKLFFKIGNYFSVCLSHFLYYAL